MARERPSLSLSRAKLRAVQALLPERLARGMDRAIKLKLLLAALPVAFVALIVVVAILAMLGAASGGVANASCGSTLSFTSGGAPTTPITGTESQRLAQLTPIYQAAALASGLNPDGPAMLAGINKVETDFGLNLSTSSAGAVGWMQFEPATWAKYGGGGDPNNPHDAIFAAARYLNASGAPGNWYGAIFAYNHADWYVQEVMGYARQFASKMPAISSAGVSPTPVALTSGAPAGQSIAPAAANAGGAPGFTPDPGANFDVNLEPSIAQRLDVLGQRLHLSIHGISGYRTPAHSVEVGGFADDPHTRGAAIDFAVNGDQRASAAQITNAQLASVGLSRPFDPTDDPNNSEVNHVQIINSDGSLLNVSAQPPIADPAQGPPAPTPTPPPIPGGAPVATTGSPVAASGSPTACPGSAVSTAPTVPGMTATIMPDGSAAAPADAPQAVKLAIAAANEIHTKPYSTFPDGHAVHYGPLSSPWPAYDCSGTVSYVLYKAGLHSATADVSTGLETWGQPGVGQWITVYANGTHTFIVIAGLAFDTSSAGQQVAGIPAGPGPRWRSNPTGNLQDGLHYEMRHPPGV